jgi:hypothetical protein
LGPLPHTTESFLKIVAYGPRNFVQSGWNVFDLVLVAGAYAGYASSLPSISTLLRVFRVLRVVRLARGSKGIWQVRYAAKRRYPPPALCASAPLLHATTCCVCAWPPVPSRGFRDPY